MSVLEEDQLLEIASDGGLKSMSETISNLHTFRIKAKVGYPEIATKALKSRLPFPASHPCEAGFSAVMAPKARSPSRVDIATHFGCHCLPPPQMGPSSCRKTSSGLPLILQHSELYNYFIMYYNVIITEIKYTINVMRLNHPETIPVPLVRGKIVFQKTGPWCPKGWGPLA